MSVRNAQSITVEFVTSNPTTQAAVNADSLPVATLVLNGADNGASVTVTNIDTGRYKAAVTLPAMSIGDIVEIAVAATVNTTPGKAIVWRDTKDVLLDSNGDVTFANTSIGSVTGDVGGNVTGSVGSVAGSVTGSVGSVTGNVGGNVTGSVGSVTGNVGGNVTGSVGSVATGGISSASFASGAINAAAIASDADTELAAAVWDLATSGHTTSGTFGAAATGGGGSAPTVDQIADAVWDEILTGATHNINNSAGKQLRTLAVNTAVIYTGICPSQAGMSSTQIKLDSGASSSNNVYQWDVISILSGTDAGDSRIVTSYVGSSKIISVNAPWTVQPDNTSVFEITPTAATQVVSYVTGQDPATLVWAAVSRTLTALPTITTNWITADGIAADAVLEIQSGLSTYAGGDTSGVTTLLSRLSDTRASNLDRLDTTISSRSDYEGQDTAGTTTLLSRLSDSRASHLDNLDAAVSSLPTATENADAMLGRNVAGGSDGVRTVSEAMYFLRNRWRVAGGILHVYETNDSSESWSAAVETSPSNPVTGVDPT